MTMILYLAIGLIGTAVTAAALARLARGWKGLLGAPYAIGSVVVFAVLFIGTLQTLVLFVEPQRLPVSGWSAELLYLTYAAVAAALSGMTTVVLGAIFLAALPIQLGRSEKRLRAYLRAGGFALAVSVLAAPLLIHNQLTISRAIAANEAELAAFRSSYKAGLERLVKVGAVREIQYEPLSVTHFIDEPLHRLGAQRLAEYAKASLLYHLAVDQNEAKPVILRDANSLAKLATYYPDGLFVVEPAYERMERAAADGDTLRSDSRPR